MNNQQLLFCDEMKILNLAMVKFSLSFSHNLVLNMEVVEEGIRIVTEGYIRDRAGKAWINSNGRVVIELKENNKENNTEKKKKKKRNMQLIDWAYINDKGEQVVIEDRCG